MGSNKRIPWQRLTLSVTGIAILAGMWRWAVFHLYSLPPHTIAAFSGLTSNVVYAIAALVIFFVTGRLVYEWKNQTATTVAEEAKQLFAHDEAAITTRTEGGAKAMSDPEIQ